MSLLVLFNCCCGIVQSAVFLCLQAVVMCIVGAIFTNLWGGCGHEAVLISQRERVLNNRYKAITIGQWGGHESIGMDH